MSDLWPFDLPSIRKQGAGLVFEVESLTVEEANRLNGLGADGVEWTVREVEGGHWRVYLRRARVEETAQT
jgi:hypothetical protein